MNSTLSPTRLLLCDDHFVVRRGLATLLDHEDDLSVVAEASDGREALELFTSLRPDIVLMDLRMPNLDGVATVVAIRALAPAAKIVIMTSFDTDEDIYRSVSAGAKGFLLKDISREELLGAVRAVAGGGTHWNLEIAARLAARMSYNELSRRENEVLHALALGQTNRAIASTLFISESTVKAHINALLKKLGAADRTQAVLIALRRGMVSLD